MENGSVPNLPAHCYRNEGSPASTVSIKLEPKSFLSLETRIHVMTSKMSPLKEQA